MVRLMKIRPKMITCSTTPQQQFESWQMLGRFRGHLSLGGLGDAFGGASLKGLGQFGE